MTVGSTSEYTSTRSLNVIIYKTKIIFLAYISIALLSTSLTKTLPIHTIFPIFNFHFYYPINRVKCDSKNYLIVISLICMLIFDFREQ